MRKAGNAKIGTLPIIESLNGIATLCIEDSYKMLENGLPNAQLELMEQVWSKHAEKVKGKLRQAIRKCIL